jgi:hypothetical protein
LLLRLPLLYVLERAHARPRVCRPARKRTPQLRRFAQRRHSMPIAKAIAPSQQSSAVSDDLPSHRSLSSRREQASIDFHSLKRENSDGFSDNPLRAYQQQQLEHERRKHRVRAAPDSWRGFLEWLIVNCTDIVDNERFQGFILICICVNSLMLGMVTFPMIKDDLALSSIFNTCDMIFLVIFTIEITMQLISRGIRYFKDGWCLFDLIIVLISWLSLSITGFYALRVFRAFRLITRVEMMRNVVVVLFHVVPAISGICVLSMLVIYIYSVLCTDLFKNYYPGVLSGDYFGRIDYSFFTLFQFICMVSSVNVARVSLSSNITAEYYFVVQDEWSSIASELV